MFLTPEENALMKLDFQQTLESSDPVNLIIRYQVPNEPVVVDPVYGTVDAAGWVDKTIETTAIQQFVKPRDYAIRQWGILEVGDCIFWLSEDLDVSKVDFDTAVFETGGVHWKPVPSGDLQKASHYAIFRTQIGQIAQVIPCKLRV